MRLRKQQKATKTVVKSRLMELIAERNLELARTGGGRITLIDVARGTGMSYATVIAIAQNRLKTISFDMMARLIDYFNLSSFDQLFTYRELNTSGCEKEEQV